MTQVPRGNRFQHNKKKRQKGLMLNVMLGIVLLTAVTVAYQLFFTSSEPASSVNRTNEEPKTEDSEELVIEETEEDTAQQEQAEETIIDEKVIVPAQDEGVLEAYTNPSWKPVGTTQQEPHTTQFDSASQDWAEMLQAISYAIDVPMDNLTILFIGNNGPNKAVGTVLEKTAKQTYKVYIEWVEKEGWKPTLVQKMK